MVEQKVCVLEEDPEEIGSGVWSLRYGFYTTVTKKTCPEIEDLKKGDKIRVVTSNYRVIKVIKDPLEALYILEDNVNV